jgi:hypothetical protein
MMLPLPLPPLLLLLLLMPHLLRSVSAAVQHLHLVPLRACAPSCITWCVWRATHAHTYFTYLCVYVFVWCKRTRVFVHTQV